jgi:hypothetical protein
MDQDGEARQFAWRVHEAQESWIGKIDVKASVVLALEGALALLALTSDPLRDLLQGSHIWARPLGFVGIGFLLVGIVCGGAAVWPFTGSVRRLRTDAPQNLIYFGHLRHLSSDKLVDGLSGLAPASELDMLARQIVATSRINWWKHRMIQASLASAFVGVAALATLIIFGAVV